MQLRVLALALLVPSVALADGEVSVRGVYYKERATRVMQPMLDAMFEAGARGLINAHFLVDAITSASASSGADNAQPFTEQRYEAGGSYTHDFGTFRLGGTLKYSTEPDYKSLYAGVRGEVDLAQKNTTLGAGVGLGSDEINAGQAQGLFNPMIACNPHVIPTEDSDYSKSCSLTSVQAFASVTQVLSRVAVLGLSYDVSRLDGYQSNPYRQVVAGIVLANERDPDERLRQAFGATLRYYVRPTKTTLIGAYRYYRDDWKVRAQTPEIRIVQQAGDSIEAAVRYRYYRQTAAFFYKNRYDASDDLVNEPYLTADQKLSKFDGHSFEAKIDILGEAFGFEDSWSEARLEGIIEYVVQNNSFGNAIIGHVAVTIPFEY
ncbi:MAG TPA: DUF3570 domain-containing protein [Kofleriaceae bacterium]|nr:DUF3570 domain-containing protein [Kofleriaceae bacterium]